MRADDPRLHGALRAIGLGMVWCGLLCGLFVAHQVWGTGWYSSQAQEQLGETFQRSVELASSSATAPTTTLVVQTSDPAPATTTLASTPPTTADPLHEAAVQSLMTASPGSVIARLVAPTIDLDQYIVEGVGVEQLRQGPGRYEGTSRLGTSGNAAVAGHRTTYGAPFSRLDELEPGDRIQVITTIGTAEYEVMDPTLAFEQWIGQVHSVQRGHVVVGPNDNYVLGVTGDDRLTLTACTPKYSARERLVVAARLVTTPFTELEPPPGLEKGQVGGPATTSTGPTDVPPAESERPENTVVSSQDSELQARVRAASAQAPTLRQGFDGLPTEVAPTILLGLLLLLTVTVLSVTGRSLGWRPAALVGTIPFLVVAWFFFEHLDRLLPAY